MSNEHTFANVETHPEGVFINAFESLPNDDGISILGILSAPFARQLGLALIAATDVSQSVTPHPTLCIPDHYQPTSFGKIHEDLSAVRPLTLDDPHGWGE